MQCNRFSGRALYFQQLITAIEAATWSSSSRGTKAPKPLNIAVFSKCIQLDICKAAMNEWLSVRVYVWVCARAFVVLLLHISRSAICYAMKNACSCCCLLKAFVFHTPTHTLVHARCLAVWLSGWYAKLARRRRWRIRNIVATHTHTHTLPHC